VRNIHAGILLLYKEALRRKSPPDSDDVLLKAKIIPKINSSGVLVFVGTGKNTVDAYQIQERFKTLGITTNWDLLKRVSDARNDLEHYVPRHSTPALEGLLANAFTIIRDFVTRELAADPLQLLGEETWQTMVEVAEVHEAELTACRSAMNQADWESGALSEALANLTCLECGSDLLRPIELEVNSVLICSRCGATEDRSSFASRAIETVRSAHAYRAYKDGDEEPYIDCPDCGEETYVMSERQCAACGFQAKHKCEQCGCDIPASEMIFSPICGYCQHRKEKILAE
jgi:hypothetical protein